MVGVKLASRLARSKSRHHTHRHAVLVMSGHRILGSGANHENQHAEVQALKNAGDAASGADVLSIRIRRSGLLGLARPCRRCWLELKRAGIRRVQYSLNDGTFMTEDIS